MKRILFVVLTGILFSLFVSSLASAEMVEVKVGKGTLKIGGILQAGFTFHVEDDEGMNAFTLNRARFLFWGDIVPDKVKYFVQTETNGTPSILDYKAQFFYIPKTEIAVGRFLPNFTLYMPVSTALLEMINYPLTTQRFAVWRQVGIQTTTKTDYVDFNLGIFNGYPANNFSDDNDAKDLLLRADVHPSVEQAKLLFGGYAWIGSASPGWGLSPEEGTLKRNRFGGFAKVDYKATDDVTLKFRGEFLVATSDYLYDNHIDSVSTTDAQAFFFHFGVQPIPQVELLARYDFHDPDTDVDDDAESWFTAGVNYYLEGINSMFYLNYIHKMEQGVVNVGNDLMVAQVQITF
ncbi:MAG: OprO/OprP family phosphate-selective porin [candidate division Zixibacteria bacterium]|nr:OprO/OprP family phosphate-selective porin [candidate division Zixibacteria bacterium]